MALIPTLIEIDNIDEKAIEDSKIETQAKHVIPYKDWGTKAKSLDVFEIPIEFCKYRLENGRIRTEILTYEKLKGKLISNEQSTQEIIHKFIGNSDKKKNSDLIKILKKDGQTDPAIITADGFLINGNRRKWALSELNKDVPDEKFKKLKVVILPGTGNAERPTVTDIALLENRLQVLVTGKSEYSKMNKALTYYSNVKAGIDLTELLKDDATFTDSGSKNFKKKVKEFENEYFKPLELMNDYLEINKVQGDYEKVANRWMSFEALGSDVMSKLNNEKFKVENNIKNDEIGTIKAAGLNLIKLKDSSAVAGDNRYLIRQIPKWISNEELKKDVLKIGLIEDDNDHIEDPDERDEEWQKQKSTEIISLVKKLQNISTRNKDQEDPLTRLSEALAKLHHEDLDMNQLKGMKIKDLDRAFKFCNDIETKNDELKRFFYYLQKGDETNISNLLKKFNNS